MWLRKELASRLIPGSAEFRDAVSKEVEAVEQRHSQRHREVEQKLVDAQHQYATLEDEFRMALTIEANRFSEVGSIYYSYEVVDICNDFIVLKAMLMDDFCTYSIV